MVRSRLVHVAGVEMRPTRIPVPNAVCVCILRSYLIGRGPIRVQVGIGESLDYAVADPVDKCLAVEADISQMAQDDQHEIILPGGTTNYDFGYEQIAYPLGIPFKEVMESRVITIGDIMVGPTI